MFFHQMVYETFLFLWIRVEDTLIELYLDGYNQHPSASSYERASGENNQDCQMLSANGLCLG